MSGGVRVTRLSGADRPRPAWSMAVFAHNEARRIEAALHAIARAAGGHAIDVFVLANGCTDATADRVRACAGVLSHLSLVEIDLGDKANAWNVYVHDLLTPERMAEVETHYFTDGDVTLEAEALPRLADALREVPTAMAAGGLPATGRDRDAWRERMVRHGSLAGNLYALRGAFVRQVRDRRLRIPVGLFGEDRFVSWLVGTRLGNPPASDDETQCVFHGTAEFSFRSLSPLRPGDYRIYLRRKWRYARRALQHEMLMPLLLRTGLEAMPAHVHELYVGAGLPSRLKWVGADTPYRLLAVLWIRSFRRRARRAGSSTPAAR